MLLLVGRLCYCVQDDASKKIGTLSKTDNDNYEENSDESTDCTQETPNGM